MTQRPGEQQGPREGPSDVPQDWGQQAPPPLPRPQETGGPAEVVPGQAGPSPVPSYGGAPPARRESEEAWAAFGDIVRKGRWSASRRSTFYQVFGDIKLDLRHVIRPGETLEVTSWSLFGDVRMAVPPGTEVEVNGGTLFGDVRAESDPAAAPSPRTGARVVVTVNSMFGDVRVREIPPEEKPPKGWRWLRTS